MKITTITLAIAAFFINFEVMAQDEALKQTKYSDNLTIVEGSGGNSGILVTDQAVVVVDTKMGGGASELHKLAKEKAGNREIIVINTHFHKDHTSGNYLYEKSTKYIGAYDGGFLEAQLEQQNLPNTLVKDSIILDLGTETVIMYNMGRNHTWTDIVVLMKKNRVLFAGDIIFYKVNPFVLKDSGANVDMWINGLDKILSWNNYKTLVPGHGEPGGKETARAMREYFMDMKTAAANPSKEKEIVARYKGWPATPGWATPEINIQFIRDEKSK